MKRSISLRLRVTLVCGVLLAVCCLLLTVSHTYSAYEMADAIEAIPLQPSRTIGACDTGAPAPAPMAEVNLPARETFRMQSVAAMAVIVVSGCLMVYWLTGKALAPLHRLDEQIRSRTVSDLDAPLPVPASADEVAGLTVSFNQMSQNLSRAFQQQKQFAQCAAHELRTPLAVLKTRMSLFRKKGLCGTPETAALLDVLEEQTERLSTLVSDLLSLANPDASGVQRARGPLPAARPGGRDPGGGGPGAEHRHPAGDRACDCIGKRRPAGAHPLQSHGKRRQIQPPRRDRDRPDHVCGHMRPGGGL